MTGIMTDFAPRHPPLMFGRIATLPISRRIDPARIDDLVRPALDAGPPSALHPQFQTGVIGAVSEFFCLRLLHIPERAHRSGENTRDIGNHAVH